ncbi:MAG: dicarboxylate/amino acid:cation symporter [bacterium]|nr:dicarboxylate/amino acid:cation symporter [bacterium]
MRTDRIKKILLSPWLILSGLVFGVIVGIHDKGLALKISPFGEAYLSLLQMCVLPILITAVVSSFGRLLNSGEAGRYLLRLGIVFVLGLVLAGVVGISVGIFSRPGNDISQTTKIALGKKIADEELSAGKPEAKSSGSKRMVLDMIPGNIFKAAAEGRSLAILFFSVLLGIALGLVRSNSSSVALTVVDAFNDAFLKIIGWLMYVLPIGLLAIVAGQIASFGLDLLRPMIKLITITYGCLLILLVSYSLIIWRRVGGSYRKSVTGLKETLMVALGTSSSFAAIPSALRGLRDGLGLERNTTNLVVPLGISLNPHGSIAYFGLVTVFMAQLYGVQIGFDGMLMVLLGSILGGVAGAGAPGVVSLGLIAYSLAYLGLPTQVAIILLTAIDPIIDPVVTMTNVYGNCASTVLVAEAPKES